MKSSFIQFNYVSWVKLMKVKWVNVVCVFFVVKNFKLIVGYTFSVNRRPSSRAVKKLNVYFVGTQLSVFWLVHNVRAATRRASGSYEVAGQSMTRSRQFSAVRSEAKLKLRTDGGSRPHVSGDA